MVSVTIWTLTFSLRHFGHVILVTSFLLLRSILFCLPDFTASFVVTFFIIQRYTAVQQVSIAHFAVRKWASKTILMPFAAIVEFLDYLGYRMHNMFFLLVFLASAPFGGRGMRLPHPRCKNGADGNSHGLSTIYSSSAPSSFQASQTITQFSHPSASPLRRSRYTVSHSAPHTGQCGALVSTW